MSLTFTDLLTLMSEHNASDLFIAAGAQVLIKADGTLKPLTKEVIKPDFARKLVLDTMNDKQRLEFEGTNECNFALSLTGTGRFRVSAYIQRNTPAMVIRKINTYIPTMDELKLPAVLKKICMSKNGLVLFVGGTSTGKSTSLASMIDYRNTNHRGHIITIEDPIEYIHHHKQSIVSQREVGVDTHSYEIALKNTLRQTPDVILMGEIRDAETMKYALSFAETGHLCMATLHANNANQALDRIISFFGPDHHNQIWMDLSLNMRAIIAQQLLPTVDGKGRRAAIEVLLNTPLIQDLVRKGDASSLKEVMEKSKNLGMQTFDQSLFDLYKEGVITLENALRYADSENNLRLMIKLDKDNSKPDDSAGQKFTLLMDN